MKNDDHRRRPLDFGRKAGVIDRLANRHARRLADSHAAFRPDDRDDLKQEMLLAVLRGIDRFDPSRGTLSAFLGRLLRNRCNELIRAKNSAMRDWRKEGPSLQQPLRGRDAAEPIDSAFSESLDERSARSHTGQQKRPDDELAMLKLDIEAVKCQLPHALRELAEMLETLPLSAIAEQLEESPRQVRKKIDMLRENFTDQDLDKYL